MRKFVYLLVVVLLFELPLTAQTPYWEEDFLEAPTGWTLDDNWSFATGKVYMWWSPVVLNYDLSAISPIISIPDDAGELIVTQFLEVYEYSVTTEECEISIIVGGDEYVIWNYSISNGNWGIAGGEDISFPLDDYVGQDVQIKFRSWGPTTDAWWGWHVYNLIITAYYDNDLSAVEITGPHNINPDETGTWDIEVKNVGLVTQSDFIVKLFTHKTGDEIGNINVTEPINPGETVNYSLDWTPSEYHNTCLYGVVILEGDTFEDNNYTNSYFVRVEPDVEYNILVWDNDNDNDNIINFETGQYEQAEAGIVKSLSKAEISYNLVSYLPTDLSSYDIILTTMGCYCLG
ncbi:MAG: hypothetical protein K8R58_14515 [Bacteroidales bacterium]|nr:hypothetical protein [Bacteroidales bacterium]